MIATISNVLIKKLTPQENRYDVWDSQIKGLMVRVFPSGRMSFRCEYARGKRITIGDTNVVSVAQARDQAKQILGEAAKGSDPRDLNEKNKPKPGDQAITFKCFFEAEYKAWLEANRPEQAHELIRRINSGIVPIVGDMPLDEIKPLVVEKWRINRLTKSHVKPITVNKEVKHLKAILNRAVKWGFISENPLADVELLKLADNSRVRFLEKDEYIRLMNALDQEEERLRQERDSGNAWRSEREYELYPDLRKQKFASSLKPKVLLSLGSGMRKCELRRLRREKHIDFQRQGLFLTPEITKARKPRFIPLDNATWQVLLDWLEQTRTEYGKTGLVFPGKDKNTEFDNMTRSWASLLKVAKIDGFNWHDMRHDYASQLVMSGVDLNTVRELLGHADLKMTIRYAHLAPEHKKIAVQSLSDRRATMMQSSS